MQSILLWLFALMMLFIAIICGGIYKEENDNVQHFIVGLVVGSLGLLAAHYA